MKKFLKVTAIVIGSILALIALGLGTTTVVNAVATGSETKNLKPYGELIEVDGKNLNVVDRGTGEQTIVLLPGLGTAAPGLDFEPLIAQLEDRFRVIAVEPLGTGLSDEAGTARTSENIAREVHGALSTMGVRSYSLMGHSIAGIYALTYVNEFPEEVTAFIGIDSSVPNQPGADSEYPTESMQQLKALGLLRVLDGLAPDMYTDLDYTPEMKDQMHVLALRHAASDDLGSEMNLAGENFAAARELSFPADLPVLLFVVSEGEDVEGWIPLHEEQIAAQTTGRMILMDGDHYLHHTLAPQIAAETVSFLDALPAR